MKRRFLLLCSMLSLLLIGCSSLFEQNKVKADVTVNASIPTTVLKTLQRSPTARNPMGEGNLEENIIHFFGNILEKLEANEHRLKLTAKGKRYAFSKEVLYSDALLNFLKEELKKVDESDIFNTIQKLYEELSKNDYLIPLSFYLNGVPMDEPLTFKATYSYKDEQDGQEILKKFSTQAVHTIKRDGQKIALQIDFKNDEETVDDSRTNQNYDRDALKEAKILEYQHVTSKTYYVSLNQGVGSGNINSPYSIIEFFSRSDTILSGVTEENIHLILTEDITLEPNSIVINDLDTHNCYLDLSGHTLTVRTVDSSSTANAYYTIDYGSTASFYIYNGKIAQESTETASNYAFAKNSITEMNKKGLLTLCGLEFENFNQKIAYQYGSGEISIEYCDFNSCQPNKNTQGLIEVSMHEDPPNNTYLGGTISQIGNRFTGCNNISTSTPTYSNPLLVIKGTMNIVDCEFDIDYTSLQENDTYKASFAYVKSKSELNIDRSTIYSKTSETLNLPAIFLSSNATLNFGLISGLENVEAHCYQSLLASNPVAILNTKELEYTTTQEGNLATITGTDTDQVTIMGSIKTEE